jgi:hypothetical protein
MPCFRCSKCGCVENTAVSNFWTKDQGSPALCSECDPKIGKWHGRFSKDSAVGMMEGRNGLLYSKVELAPGGYFGNNKSVQAEGPFREIVEGNNDKQN